MKKFFLAVALGAAVAVTYIAPTPYLGSDTAHAAGKATKKAAAKKGKRVAKKKGARAAGGKKARSAKGPGQCGTFMFYKNGKCNDARSKK